MKPEEPAAGRRRAAVTILDGRRLPVRDHYPILACMAIIQAQPFSRQDFRALSEFMSRNAAWRMPGSCLMLPGDLAWRLPGAQPTDNLMLFRDSEGIAAYAWFEPDTGFEFDLRHGLSTHDQVMRALLDWAEARRRQLPPAYPRFVDLRTMDDWAREIQAPASQEDETRRCLTTVALESQPNRIAALAAAGYRPTAHCNRQYRRDLSDVIEVPPTPGRLRAVTHADLDARVAVHRAAWLGSSWDLGRYRAVRSTPAYRASLDIVLDVDGTFAGYCICWADELSKLGLFEPVGTRPEWRGRGAGRAVILEGLRRLRDAGMQAAQVGTAGFNAPAQALYESCGFIPHDTARTFMKVIA